MLAKGFGSRGPAASIHWRVTRRQRADFAIEREWLGHAAKQMEADDTRRLRIARDARRPRAAP